MSGKHIFKLYITGQTPRSKRSIINLRKLFEKDLNLPYELTIVDILEQPNEAERDQILATPTLLRVSPLPERRVIGDLSNYESLLRGLDLEVNEVKGQ